MNKPTCPQFIQECKDAAAIKREKQVADFKVILKPFIEQFPTLEIIDPARWKVSICEHPFTLKRREGGELYLFSDLIRWPWGMDVINKADFGEYILAIEEQTKGNEPPPQPMSVTRGAKIKKTWWQKLFA